MRRSQESLLDEIRGKLARLGTKDDEAQAGLRKPLEDLASTLEASVNSVGVCSMT